MTKAETRDAIRGRDRLRHPLVVGERLRVQTRHGLDLTDDALAPLTLAVKEQVADPPGHCAGEAPEHAAEPERLFFAEPAAESAQTERHVIEKAEFFQCADEAERAHLLVVAITTTRYEIAAAHVPPADMWFSGSGTRLSAVDPLDRGNDPFRGSRPVTALSAASTYCRLPPTTRTT